MAISFWSLYPSEHDNGAAIGTLNFSRAEPGSFEIYWENQKDIFQIKDDILYLTSDWRYDIAAGSSGLGEYRS